MKKNGIQLISTLSFLAFFILSNVALAQSSLRLVAEKAPANSTNVPFYNLEEYDLYQLDGKTLLDFTRQNKNQPFSFHLVIDKERSWEMELEPSKVHGADFKVITSTGEEMEVEQHITYKGYLKNDPTTAVRMTIANNLIAGTIFGAENYSFEVLEKAPERTANDLIAIYKNNAANMTTTACGLTSPNHDDLDEEEEPIAPNLTANTNRMAAAITYCVKLGVSVDWQALDKAGSLANFNSDLQTMINVVNGYYDDFGVEYVMNPLHVVTSAPNPWPDVSSTSSQLLHNYGDWALPNLTPTDYNCALLFTGTDQHNTSWAFLGQMCPDDDDRFGEIDYYSTNTTLAHKGNLTSHELGHLWGANHGSSSSSTIMSPGVYAGTLQWTSSSFNLISNAVNSTFNNCMPACSGHSISVTRGPYLQNGTPSSIVVKWRTRSSTDSKVWYGTSLNNLTQTVTSNGSRTDHELQLTGLSPNTIYYYAIGDNTGQMAGDESDFYFKTSPIAGTAQSVRAWILGDCGTANSNQEAVRNAYYNHIGNKHTDMILFLGDNAYNSGTDSEYQNAIFNIYNQKLKNTTSWSCPGNHDYLSGSGLNRAYYDIFTFPKTGEAGGLASNTEKYYSFDYSNIHIVSLDSHDENRNPGSPMLTWLENDLSATSQEWIIVIFHHPPYSKGSHNSDSESRMVEMRENVLPILENHGVDLVLSGHSHAYERSRLINGHYDNSNTFNVGIHAIDNGDGRLDGNGAYQQNASQDGTVYIVTGSAGKRSSMSGRHPIMYYSESELGSTILEVNGGQMDVKFLNNNGTVKDYLTLVQNGTPTVSWTNPFDGEIFTNLNALTFNATASDSDGSISKVEFFVNGSSIGTDVSAPYSMNWTPPAFANYTLKITATDNDNKTNSKEITITVQDGISIDISSQISSTNDDVEERIGDGDMDMDSGDLELVEEGASPQIVGMRFNNINVPKNATITKAYIQFTVDETDSGTTNLTIKGEAHDNAPAFFNSDFNVSTRTTTTASIAWSPIAWNSTGVAGTAQQTTDLSPIIQEIIGRSGWSPNNSMALIISGTGERTAESYDGTAAPTLHITYTLGTPCDGLTDIDEDGYCSDVDCNDNDANIFIGAACNDGNTATVDDKYDDNCDCKGSVPILTISARVNSSSDDVEERVSDGDMDITSSDLEMVDEGGSSNQLVGIRFNNIDVPKGSIISNAYVQFTTDDTNSGTTNLIIQGQDHDNAPTFVDTDFNVSTRTKTSASITWNPAAWNSTGEAGLAQQTPDLSAIIQEIVGRSGWSPNNSMALIISGSGERTADSYDGLTPFNAPKLYFTYSLFDPCGTIGDVDGDGQCVDVDCDDNNAAIYKGATCDDGNANTSDDIYDDNCECKGSVPRLDFSVSITSSDNDAEERMSDGDMSISSTDLELVEEGGTSTQLVGLRFNDIAVPPGATISNAYIQFTVDETDDVATNLTIKGQAHDNAPVFTNSDFNISTRATTSAAISWVPAAWTSNGLEGAAQQTPNISPIIQEIINRPGWLINNELVLIISGSGERTAESYNGSSSAAPRLHISYSTIPTCENTGDVDKDGYCADVDCDDNNSAINPGATEICDGIDNDCDGQIDEGACPTDYCTPIHQMIANELITNVSIGTINNSSVGWNTSTTGYSDYTKLSTQVAIGTSYSIMVTSNYSWIDSKFGIWADWNQNSTFESNEKITTLSGAGPWTTSFTPPAGAKLGTTRLRVRLQYGPNYTPDPCAFAGYFSGETEDYSIEVFDCLEAGCCQGGCVCQGTIITLDENSVLNALTVASDEISSEITVSTGTSIVFHSGGTITLLPGFYVEVGASFTAVIESCVAPSIQDTSESHTAFRSQLVEPVLLASIKNEVYMVNPSEAIKEINNNTIPIQPFSNGYNKKPTIKVYPNPLALSETLHLELLGFEDQVRIGIFDVMGRLVQDFEQSNNLGDQLTIASQNLAQGIYFLSVSDKTNLETVRVVVQE